MIRKTHLTKIVLIQAFLLASGSFAGVVDAVEKKVVTQAPGYRRMVLGDFIVTAVYDGSLELNMNAWKNEEKEALRELLECGFLDPMKYRIEVTAFIVDTGKEKVLVDTGSGSFLGPSLGKAFENLETSGYTSKDITSVFITHMHPDHVGGLVDKNGKPRFEKATIYSAKVESDFWLSAENEEKAPEDMKNYFSIARTCTASYLEAGNWKRLEPGETPVQGIKIVPAPGHTPGHSAYEMTSKGETMIIVGDAIHSAVVQFSRPDFTFFSDINSLNAIETRKILFEDIARRKVWVGAPHLPFPGIGKLRKETGGSYAFIPVRFSQPE